MRSSYLIAFVLLIFACGEKQERIPTDVLSEEQMVLIIKDLQLLEAAHKDIPIYGKEKQLMTDTSYVIVLNKYRVERDLWEHSYDYYTGKPERFNRLMGLVEDAIHESK